MGRFLKETTVKVALVGVPKAPAEKITERLATRGEDDPGNFLITPIPSSKACLEAMEGGRITAVCVGFRALDPVSLVAFIGDIRVTHPLIPICLVGTRKDLAELPGLHAGWRERLSHYYKISEDSSDADLSENVGLLRDLFVADAVKTRALGQYDTTPGAVVKLKNAPAHGFWIQVVITIVAALIGATLGPLVTHYLAAQNP